MQLISIKNFIWHAALNECNNIMAYPA